MMLAGWLLAVGVACLLVEYWRRNRRMFELAAKVPGMKTLPLIGNAHQFAGNTEHLMNIVKKVTDSYADNGYIYKIWLGPKLLFAIGDPADAEMVLKTCLEKHDVIRYLRVLSGNGLIFAPVSVWKNRRKIVMPAFSRKVLDTFIGVFQEQSEILVQQLEKHAGKGPVRLCRILNACTLDSVSETAMGVQLKAQTVKHSPYLQAVENAFEVICIRIFNVLFHSNFIFGLSSLFKKQQQAVNVIFNFTDEVIRKKRKQLEDEPEKELCLDSEDALSKRRPFLDLLIGLSGKENAFSDIELREEVLTIIIAGTDTSSLGIGYTLLTLGAHPHIQNKLYDEITEKIGNEPITKDNLSTLSYLEAVVKESMRLYPPVPLILRKVEKEFTLPSGYTLPAGSGAVVNIYGLHRHKGVWGEDVHQFRPERFLEESNRHPCSYIPFSYSFRSCLGYQYAMMSMKTVVANVIRNYRVKAKLANEFKLEIMMRPTEGIKIELEKRI